MKPNKKKNVRYYITTKTPPRFLPQLAHAAFWEDIDSVALVQKFE